MIECKVTGANAVEQAILELARRLPTRVGDALKTEAELTMTEAKELCPVMDGHLRGSGFVTDPIIDSREIGVILGFGGPAAPYALSVHENPRAGKTGGWSPKGWMTKGEVTKWRGPRKYKKWAKVGQWKFLEQPFLARRAGFEERIRGRVLGEF